MKGKHYFFTSESVTAGHPDKMMDMVSDGTLDAIFKKDPNARVAAEAFTKTGFVMVGGVVLMLPLALYAVGGLDNATQDMAKMTPPDKIRVASRAAFCGFGIRTRASRPPTAASAFASV